MSIILKKYKEPKKQVVKTNQRKPARRNLKSNKLIFFRKWLKRQAVGDNLMSEEEITETIQELVDREILENCYKTIIT